MRHLIQDEAVIGESKISAIMAREKIFSFPEQPTDVEVIEIAVFIEVFHLPALKACQCALDLLSCFITARSRNRSSPPCYMVSSLSGEFFAYPAVE